MLLSIFSQILCSTLCLIPNFRDAEWALWGIRRLNSKIVHVPQARLVRFTQKLLLRSPWPSTSPAHYSITLLCFPLLPRVSLSRIMSVFVDFSVSLTRLTPGTPPLWLTAVSLMVTVSPMAHSRNLIVSREWEIKSCFNVLFLPFLCSLYTNLD